MILLSILILSLPTVWELWSERKGEDPKKKGRSMTVRAVLMIVCACVSSLIHDYAKWGNGDYLDGLLTFAKSLLLSFAIFFLFFDYCINLILGRKPWYSYLSKSPLDKLFGKVNWRVRMAIRVVVFITAIVLFVLPAYPF